MESETVIEKAAEYVARKFPNADLGYCSYLAERYKSVFIAGYEQYQKDIAEEISWRDTELKRNAQALINMGREIKKLRKILEEDGK